MQTNLGPTGMYGVVSKILMPCQTFQFKDESSPKSISSNMQIHLSLKNSRNIFYESRNDVYMNVYYAVVS